MSKAKHSEPTSAFALFTKSKEAVLKNLNVFLILYIIPLFFTLVSMRRLGRMERREGIFNGTNPFVNFPPNAIAALVGLGSVFVVVGVVLGALYQAMVTSLEFKAVTSKDVQLGVLWNMAKKYALRLFLFSVLYALLIAFGLIYFIIPGIIVIRRYYLAPYAMIDKDLSIGDAMRYSAEISKPHAMSVWSVIGVTFLIGLTGAVPIFGGILSLALSMLYSVAPAFRYVELKKLNG